MRKAFRWLIDLLGLPGDIETLGRLILGMLTLSGGTGIWALFTEGLPWAVFIATGVFFFGVSAYVILTNAYTARRLVNKIYVADLGAMQWRVDGENANVSIEPLVALNSIAPFEIFFDVVASEHTLGGVTATPDRTRTLRGVLPPHGFANISLASVKTDHKFPDGRLILEVQYGRERLKYTHAMKTTLEFFPTAHLPPDKQGFLNMRRNIIELEYERLPENKGL